MGIKNLTKLLKENNINGKNINIKSLEGSFIAIDTSNFICKFHYGNHNILDRFIELLILFIKYNITPIFIFDGKTPNEKKEEKKKRREDHKKYKEKLNEKLLDMETIDFKLLNKYNQLNNFPIEIFNDLKKMFKLLNISYIIAEEEADDMCKLLSKYNLVDYVISEDRDFLISNENTLNSLSIKNETLVLWNRSNIIDKLNLKNIKSFIDLGILLGCDYTKSIPKIGYKTSYKIILKYDYIDNFLLDKKNKKFDTTEFFWKDARNRFNKYEIDKLLIYDNRYMFYINYNKIDKNKLNKLSIKFKISKDLINILLNYIKKYYENINKSLLSYKI
jgi:flap endonuclease-1